MDETEQKLFQLELESYAECGEKDGGGYDRYTKEIEAGSQPKNDEAEQF